MADKTRHPIIADTDALIVVVANRPRYTDDHDHERVHPRVETPSA
ncbi:hypothetical protein [Halocatena pleomorpha]|nr:hypothetical protein [Halocatena pleomorpha]